MMSAKEMEGDGNMTEEDMTDKEFLITVAEALRSVCDGARTEDGVGFNKYDAQHVRGILKEHEEYENLATSKWRSLKKGLIKYKGQIENMGYDYDRIPSMSFEEKVVHDDVEVELKTNGDTEIWIATPYNEDFVSKLKYKVDEYNRRFDWDSKSWIVTVKPNSNDSQKAIETIEEHFDVEIDIDIPEVEFGTATSSEDECIRLDTYYDEDFVSEVKKFDDREYDSSRKDWLVDFSSLDEIDKFYELVEEWNVEVDSSAQIYIDERKEKLLEEEMKHQEMVELSKQKSIQSDYEVPLPNPELELYDFQKYAVKMMDKREKGLIADEMGAGKTVEVLAHLYNRPERRPVLVVVPSSVKINWKREITKWTESKEEDIEVLRGYEGDIDASKSWYVINYAILPKRIDSIKELDYEAVIFDESHYIKNHEAQRTKASLELADDTEHVYALSGTPMPNRPIELWTQLQSLKPEEEDFKSLWGYNGSPSFAKKYCNAKQTKWGWDVNGASNLDELYRKLRENVMVRRKKEDVLDELPEKRRITVPLDITNKKEYNEAVKNFRGWMKDKEPNNTDWKNAEHLAKIEKLKQLAVEGKKENMFDWLDDMVEQTEKLVIFAHHTDMQNEIYERYKDISVKITGGMSGDSRQETVDEFTDGEAEVCVVSLIAGGEGINLQVADRLVFTEVNWTPKEHNQAEDRIHRINQENRCDVYYLLADGTIEESIFNLINEKQKSIDEAIDGVTDESQKGMIVDVVEDMMEDDNDE